MEWPVEVDARLRAIVRIAEDATGTVTSAGEVLSALVCSTPLSRNGVRRLLAQFRSEGVTRAAKGIKGSEQASPRLGRPRRVDARARSAETSRLTAGPG